jgi:hypothetical protein
LIAPKPFEFKRNFFRADFLSSGLVGVERKREAPSGYICSHKLWKTM